MFRSEEKRQKKSASARRFFFCCFTCFLPFSPNTEQWLKKGHLVFYSTHLFGRTVQRLLYEKVA